jgi:hypothetical protein
LPREGKSNSEDTGLKTLLEEQSFKENKHGTEGLETSPKGCEDHSAEKTLNGLANQAANKWCGPYNNANKAGWWISAPTDLDVMWKSGANFEYRHIEPYTDDDHQLIRSLIRKEDGVDPDQWCQKGGRTKFTWGAADDGVFQVWSGCVFATPPGWGLMVRSPANVENRAYRIQDGILETDWMYYDIWFNVKVLIPHKWVYIRREQWPPLAQLIPVPRASYDPTWTVSEQMVHRDTEEGEKVFKYWIDYNHQKFGKGGRQHLSAEFPQLKKDSTTYFRERKEHLSRCPFAHVEYSSLDNNTPIERQDTIGNEPPAIREYNPTTKVQTLLKETL